MDWTLLGSLASVLSLFIGIGTIAIELRRIRSVDAGTAKGTALRTNCPSRSLPRPPASLLRRGMALLVDMCWLDLASFVSLALLFRFASGKGASTVSAGSQLTAEQVLYFLLAFTLPLAAMAVLLGGWAVAGTSFGKYVFGLRIYTLEGSQRIGWRKALARFLCFFVTFGFWFVIFFNDRRQAVHDLAAGTYVAEES